MILKKPINKEVKKAIKEILSGKILKVFSNKQSNYQPLYDKYLTLAYYDPRVSSMMGICPSEYELGYFVCGNINEVIELYDGIEIDNESILVRELYHMWMEWLIFKTKKKYVICFEGEEEDGYEAAIKCFIVKRTWLEETK